jgi:hypothetical protein
MKRNTRNQITNRAQYQTWAREPNNHPCHFCKGNLTNQIDAIIAYADKRLDSLIKKTCKEYFEAFSWHTNLGKRHQNYE